MCSLMFPFTSFVPFTVDERRVPKRRVFEVLEA